MKPLFEEERRNSHGSDAQQAAIQEPGVAVYWNAIGGAAQFYARTVQQGAGRASNRFWN